MSTKSEPDVLCAGCRGYTWSKTTSKCTFCKKLYCQGASGGCAKYSLYKWTRFAGGIMTCKECSTEITEDIVNFYSNGIKVTKF
jgi:hypothetical protein